jgi:hypothetical protein
MPRKKKEKTGKTRPFSIRLHGPEYRIICKVEVPTNMLDDEKVSTTMAATVEKIIKPLVSGEPEKAQISVEGADHLYREIRIENTMTTPDGETVGLKPGAEVNVVIEADPEDTENKSDQDQDWKKAS